MNCLSLAQIKIPGNVLPLSGIKIRVNLLRPSLFQEELRNDLDWIRGLKEVCYFI